jgi:hypothetical protein
LFCRGLIWFATFFLLLLTPLFIVRSIFFGRHCRHFSNTVPDDDDPEWNWPQNNDKKSRTTNNHSGHSPRHRGSSSSPPFGSYNSNVSSGNSTSVPMDIYNSPHSEKKGFSVKKTGMNNPLHSSNVSQQSPSQLPTARISNRNANSNSVVGLGTQKPSIPSSNDFFSDMGLDTKPKFGTASTLAPTKKRLGAVALPVDTSKDSWGDDDLDDFLD